jgi:hypothetical protein
MPVTSMDFPTGNAAVGYGIGDRAPGGIRVSPGPAKGSE